MPPGLGCGGSECPWKDASFLTCSGPVGQFSLSLVLCVSRGTAWSSGPAGPGLADSCALTERPPIHASLGRCPRESRGLPGTLPSAGKWSEERVTKRRCAPGVHRPASQGVGESLAPRGAHAHPERGGLCCSRVGLAWSLEWSGLGESPSVQEPCPHQDVYQRGACSGCPPNPVPTDPILLTLKLGDTCIPDKRVLMARAHSPQSAEQRPLRQGGAAARAGGAEARAGLAALWRGGGTAGLALAGHPCQALPVDPGKSQCPHKGTWGLGGPGPPPWGDPSGCRTPHPLSHTRLPREATEVPAGRAAHGPGPGPQETAQGSGPFGLQWMSDRGQGVTFPPGSPDSPPR